MKSIALLLCVVLTASTSAVFAQSEKPAEDVFTKFQTLRGEVVDSHGNGIEKFSVNAAVHESFESFESFGDARAAQKPLGRWEAKDVQGKFSFVVEQPIVVKPHSLLVCQINAEGFLPVHDFLWGMKEISEFDGNFGTVALKRAVKVTGRLVLTASAGDEKILDPIVRFTSSNKSSAAPFHQGAEFSDDGSFEAILPEDCQVKMIAYSKNAAAISKTVTIEKFDPAKDAQDLGEFQLPEGVAVAGVVLTRNGSPVENQSIYLTQKIDGQHVHTLSITDVLGEFELPPRLGEVIVRLNEEVGADGKATNSTGRKLTASPVELTLRPGEPVKPIEFREAETFLISGSVALEDGRIPKQVYVAISGQDGTSHDQQVIGKDGEFAFAIARGLKTSLIIMHKSGDKESFFVCSLSGDSLLQNRDAIENYQDDVQIFNFKPIQKNIGPLDFILQKHTPEPTTATEKVFNWILGN